MSAPARVRQAAADFRAQQAIELLVTCVRESFTGSVEIHFHNGRAQLYRRTVTAYFESKPQDLIPRG